MEVKESILENNKETRNIVDPNALKNQKEVVLSIKNLSKSFGSKKVLVDINLDLHRGENIVVLGRSGEGKSVSIKCIVGLLTQDSGSIEVLGEEVKELSKEDLKALRIKIGFLFQSGALYDSMTVRENLAFPLQRVLKIKDQKEIDDRIHEMLDGVGLLEAIDKLPSELSGGMRKRIGLARTLILKPEIMLYDEPTTGLDPITSGEISELLISMQNKYKISSIIITHDIACAKMVADKIMIMSEGKFIVSGTFSELANSKNPQVNEFFKEPLEKLTLEKNL